MAAIQTRFTCAKGNDHWLSHVTDWDGEQWYRQDGCYVHITIMDGERIHLTVLPDLTPPEAAAKGWYVDPTYIQPNGRLGGGR